jgi:endonuclease YncB( thermonuclease family)
VSEAGWTWPLARVVTVHDADTLKLDVDCGFSLHAYAWIRLRDVHAPELSEADGPKARQDVLDWLAQYAPDSRVQVVTFRTSRPLEIRFRESFTRYIGVVFRDGMELNEWLRVKGWIDRGE